MRRGAAFVLAVVAALAGGRAGAGGAATLAGGEWGVEEAGGRGTPDGARRTLAFDGAGALRRLEAEGAAPAPARR